MKFTAKSTDVATAKVDVLVVFAWQDQATGGNVASAVTKKIDHPMKGLIRDGVKAEAYEAALGSLFVAMPNGAIPARLVLVLGLGKPDALSVSGLQRAVAVAARKAIAVKATRVAIGLAPELFDKFDVRQTAQHVVEGFWLGTYSFWRHKSEASRQKDVPIEEVQVHVARTQLKVGGDGIQAGEVISRAVMLARDLVNEPPSVTTPNYLANLAQGLAKGTKAISAEILGPQEMRKLQMGGLLGIAQGSDEEARFIRLSYKGRGTKTVTLVGKGITFDTGGLSLKTAEGMETMKADMAGAAAVLGVFSALATLQPEVNVVGLICATENMPSAKAVKPGDVVRAMNGKTIEILNTDAEGRVVLADGLSYAAEKVKPDAIIDLATLTGACVVALGEKVAGLFSNDSQMVADLKTAAEQSGEHVWELPLVQDYKDLMKSTVADLKNISGKRYGGAITAALFLQEFVPEGTPWAHFDIAGPAFTDNDTPLEPRGGTGFGVRMLLTYLQSFS